jgi:hypothetical protein
MNPLHHPATAPPVADLEKAGAGVVNVSSRNSGEKNTLDSSSASANSPPLIPVPTRLQRWNNKIESLSGLEARGIARVLPEERHGSSVMGYAQMAILWFSANVTANNLAVGLLGPLLFELGFVDSALMAAFGSLVGSIPTAYMSTWGAQSGNRTMVGIIILLDSGHKLIEYCYPDRGPIFHGVQPGQDHLLPQHDNYGRVWYYRLHH